MAGGQSKPIFWWGKKARTTKRIMLGMLRLALSLTETQENAGY